MPEQIGVAVLGSSSFAEEHHIPDTNSHPRAKVLALYSRGLDRAKEMAGRTGVPEASEDEPSTATPIWSGITHPPPALGLWRGAG